MTIIEFIKQILMTIGLCWILDKALRIILMPFVNYKRHMKNKKEK